MRDPTVAATNMILGWLAFMWLFTLAPQTSRNELVMDYPVRRYRPWFAVLIFLPVMILVAFGIMRYDMYAYAAGFRDMLMQPESIARMFSQSREKGFVAFNVALRLLIGRNVTLYRVALMLVHAVPVIVILRRYSENYLFSIYLFVATTCHMAWMMNGIRQFIAVTLIFGATPLMLEKKYLRAVLVVLLAMTFHRSAVMMIPAMFIVQGKPWNKWTLLFSALMIAATVVFARSEEAFEVVAETAGYSLEAARDGGDDGMNPVRALISAVPMILAFLSRAKLWEEDNPIINLCTNMSVITTGVSMVAVVTSGIMVGRMPIYTSLWNLILLPHVIRITFEGQSRFLVTAAAVGLYFLFYLYSTGLI